MAKAKKLTPSAPTIKIAGTDPAANPAKQDDSNKKTAFMMDDLDARRLRFAFLQLSYEGGTRYKSGRDCYGRPVLIEHESEIIGGELPTKDGNLYANMVATKAASTQQFKSNRYQRRERSAVYENHVRPIVDKITGYLCRAAATRYDGKKEDLDRIEIQERMEELIEYGCRLGEYWIGFDSAAIPSDASVTQAEVDKIDPKHGGKPYIVLCDPSRIVDCDIDETSGVVSRVVIEETTVTKSGFTDPKTVRVSYKEWTDTEWVVYRKEDNTSAGDGSAFNQIAVVEEARGTHTFGVCPWYRFKPALPIEDICEVARAAFNVSSLLDEELVQSTFTQRWATGIRREDAAKFDRSNGSLWVIEDPQGKFGVFGAFPGQAEALMSRIERLTASIYRIASMENTAPKNVAESGEKKRRDLEALYTMLVKIAQQVQKTENALLTGMKVISEDNTEQQTKYDTRFDVSSVEELQRDIASLGSLPFVAPSFKRRVIEQLCKKLDPFGKHDLYSGEAGKMLDTSIDLVEAVQVLRDMKAATPEMICDILGIPEDQRSEVIDQLDEHPEPPPGFDENGDPLPPGDGGDGQEGDNGDGKPQPPFGGKPGAGADPRADRGAAGPNRPRGASAPRGRFAS